jgi:hypothetical protein
MKQLFLLIFLCLTSYFSNGQACGIYRIEYFGNIISTNNEIKKIYLPSTLFLHGLEKDYSKKAFIDFKLSNSFFKVEINSHLTTPYTNINQLLSFYKKQADTFKMKISYMENGSLTESIIEIEWNKIELSIKEDGNFGTLFSFNLNNILI